LLFFFFLPLPSSFFLFKPSEPFAPSPSWLFIEKSHLGAGEARLGELVT